ncbi:hypothetical protein, partial [Staphylococcus aureus]|uniref:hypothetical protein n=1 Tax=Staphylococcus aureus TaxID=1280 RepID=UPI0021B0E7A3
MAVEEVENRRGVELVAAGMNLEAEAVGETEALVVRGGPRGFGAHAGQGIYRVVLFANLDQAGTRAD